MSDVETLLSRRRDALSLGLPFVVVDVAVVDDVAVVVDVDFDVAVVDVDVDVLTISYRHNESVVTRTGSNNHRVEE